MVYCIRGCNIYFVPICVFVFSKPPPLNNIPTKIIHTPGLIHTFWAIFGSRNPDGILYPPGLIYPFGCIGGSLNRSPHSYWGVKYTIFGCNTWVNHVIRHVRDYMWVFCEFLRKWYGSAVEKNKRKIGWNYTPPWNNTHTFWPSKILENLTE